jgi:processive 1,2-diacylglycerol beta-glucosyltransferase
MEQGVAVKAHDSVSLEYKIAHLLANRDKLARMRENMRGLGRPGAAGVVLDWVLRNGS